MGKRTSLLYLTKLFFKIIYSRSADAFGHEQTVRMSTVDSHAAQVSNRYRKKDWGGKCFDAGDCGAASNGFKMECNGIGGQPPATFAEFTLNGYGGSDYYDLSNVDGHTISMTIQPIPGQYTSVNNPSLGKYNCGTVSSLN